MVASYHISVDDGFGIYTNKENGYALFITSDTTYFYEINHLTAFKDSVAQLLDRVKSPFRTEADIQAYNRLSYFVYDQLFPSPAVKALVRNKNLRIIPDSYLSLLPFEALSVAPDNSEYLIEHCTPSYLYSYSFHQQNLNQNTTSTASLGMAPVQFNDSNLSSLFYSKNEIVELEQQYEGAYFMDSSATKQAFLDNLGHYGLIHLATHADAQEATQPWIAFSDEKLALNELNLTQNNASLVVLSGCNTTLGEQAIGEGVISLARGFFYGGTQSVVSSLWSIDDKATPYLMNAFYENLSQGNNKSAALRTAKLDYLENHSLSELSPYYWASFILIGKDDALPVSNPMLMLVIGLILFLLLGGLYFRSYFK